MASTNRNEAPFAPMNSHMFDLELGGGEPRQLTTGNASHSGPRFAPDSRSLCFRKSEDWGKISALDRLACAPWPWTGSVTLVTSKLDRSVADFAIAPDRRIFLTAEDGGYVRFYAVPACGGEVTPVLDARGAFGKCRAEPRGRP